MRYWTLLDPTTDNSGGFVMAGTLVARPDDWEPPRRAVAAASAGTNTPTDELRAIECDETGKPLPTEAEKAAAEQAAKEEKEAPAAAAVDAQLNPTAG